MTQAPAIRPLVAGNWKMNGLAAALREVEAAAAGYDAALAQRCDLLICPPATLVAAAKARSGRVAIGGQTCHEAASGAFTGEIAAEMLADAGASHVIVGHSERRALFGESDAAVKAKAAAAHRAGLVAIVCVGETEAERKAGRALAVVAGQLAASLPDIGRAAETVVAYEPVWAIGTGLTPTPADVGEMHAAIRAALVGRYGEEGRRMRILYGGSVKPSNAVRLAGLHLHRLRHHVPLAENARRQARLDPILLRDGHGSILQRLAPQRPLPRLRGRDREGACRGTCASSPPPHPSPASGGGSRASAR